MIVKFGVECGSDELRRKILERHMSNQAIIDAFDLCHQYGLHSSAFLMIGLPYETRGHDRREYRVDGPHQTRPDALGIFFPFVGTRSYTICQLGGLIDYRRMDEMGQLFLRPRALSSIRLRIFLSASYKGLPLVCQRPGRPGLSGEYQKLIDEVEAMNTAQWQKASDNHPSNVIARFPMITWARVKSTDAAAMKQYNTIRFATPRLWAVDSDLYWRKRVTTKTWQLGGGRLFGNRSTSRGPLPPAGADEADTLSSGLPELHIVQSAGQAQTISFQG